MSQAKIMKCHAITLDPLHIGAGGYRLGRVDNTIVREPGTDLPKIPGSSISGVCRNYAIYRLDEDERNQATACATDEHKDKRGNCGKCAICNTFGFAAGESGGRNQVGRVKFFDARLVAFPVRTMTGPAWVTTAGALGLDQAPQEDRLWVNFDLRGNRLNLGWLYLEAEKREFSLPPGVTESREGMEMNRRLVIAPDTLYPEIVNSNLEVRTSVSIDFETGAAKKGALFTYEAVPRAALFTFDVVVDAYRCTEEWSPARVEKIVREGLGLFGLLGAGGMNTRGFGRMKIIVNNASEGGA